MNLSIGTDSIFNPANDFIANTGKADSLKAAINKSSATDEELMEACKSFEAYLLEQVFKGMEKTILKEEEDDPYLNQFGDKLYEEYAKSATEGQGLGLAQMLYESMKRNA